MAFTGHGLGTQREDNERAAAKVKTEARTTGDPQDHSHKVFLSGQKLGERGTSMRGHAAALVGLRSLTVKY